MSGFESTFTQNANHLVSHLINTLELGIGKKIREAGGDVLAQNETLTAIDNLIAYAMSVALEQAIPLEEALQLLHEVLDISDAADRASATRNRVIFEVILPKDSPLVKDLDELFQQFKYEVEVAMKTCPHPVTTYTVFSPMEVQDEESNLIVMVGSVVVR